MIITKTFKKDFEIIYPAGQPIIVKFKVFNNIIQSERFDKRTYPQAIMSFIEKAKIYNIGIYI